MNNTKRLRGLMAVLIGLFLVACSGGGGAAPPAVTPPPIGNSNWDSMIWNQDNWV